MAGTPLDDHLTLDDKLGRISLLHDVYYHVTKATPPCVIGIHGDWGAGKSSFLMQLEGLLTNFRQAEGQGIDLDPKQVPIRKRLLQDLVPGATYPVVWFEAWRHQSDPQPILSLLREIRNQLSPARKSWGWLKKEGTVAIETALSGIDGISKFIGVKLNPKEIRESGERYEAANFQVPSFTVSVSEILDKAISQILSEIKTKTNADRLVVMIDDLDRCSPETAQAILEGLKVFLNLKHVVFVIAMDETVVEEFIAQKYKDSEADPSQCRKRARQYLEKLCQTIYRLPLAAEPKKRLVELIVQRNNDLKGHIVTLEEQWKDLTVVPPNPRKIKLLAEVTHRFLLKVAPDDKNGVALAYVLAYCFQFEPELYRLIETYKAQVFTNWLLPAVGYGSLSQPVKPQWEIAMPKELQSVIDASFPDPIRSGVFYPAGLVKKIGEQTDSELTNLLR